VTFLVTSENGKVDSETSVTKTVSGGQTTAAVTADGEGDITVVVSTLGAKPVTVSLVVPEAAAIGEGPVGPMALDLNTEVGDQEQRQTTETPNPGDTVVIDLVATSGASGLSGYQATLSFDPTQLTFETANGFAVAGLFTGGLPIVTTSEGVARAAVAFLGGSTTSDASGSLGKFTFTVADGYKGETRVTLISGQYGTASGQEKLTIGSGGAAVLIGGLAVSGPVTVSPDIDGDGSVGFGDFLIFAGVFGKSSGDDGFNAAADLNSDGSIGFPDFLTFAAAFGKPVESKPALAKPTGHLPGANGTAGLSLLPIATQNATEAIVAIRMTEATEVMGYNLQVQFDPMALELANVTGAEGSVFDTEGVALQNASADGKLLLADVLRPDAMVSGDQNLVLLRFNVLNPTISGRIEIVEALVADGANRMNTLVGAHLDDVRALPDTYSLSQNYPNPFNPETVVPFALPVSGDIRVAVYNVLGQEVVVLADGYRAAGFHRLIWNGQDALGRPTSSGIYFVRMVANDFSSVRKMLLLK
jgi:hypothetical protein